MVLHNNEGGRSRRNAAEFRAPPAWAAFHSPRFHSEGSSQPKPLLFKGDRHQADCSPRSPARLADRTPPGRRGQQKHASRHQNGNIGRLGALAPAATVFHLRFRHGELRSERHCAAFPQSPPVLGHGRSRCRTQSGAPSLAVQEAAMPVIIAGNSAPPRRTNRLAARQILAAPPDDDGRLARPSTRCHRAPPTPPRLGGFGPAPKPSATGNVGR